MGLGLCLQWGTGVRGGVPLKLTTYQQYKHLFYIYTFSKVVFLLKFSPIWGPNILHAPIFSWGGPWPDCSYFIPGSATASAPTRTRFQWTVDSLRSSTTVPTLHATCASLPRLSSSLSSHIHTMRLGEDNILSECVKMG